MAMIGELFALRARTQMEAARMPHPAFGAMRHVVDSYVTNYGVHGRKTEESGTDRRKSKLTSSIKKNADKGLSSNQPIDPAVMTFVVPDSKIRISGSQIIRNEISSRTLYATFPDQTRVGLLLTDIPGREPTLQYLDFSTTTLGRWSPTPPADNFYTERIHALWPSIDLRTPVYEPLRILRPKEKAALADAVTQVESLRDQGFLDADYRTIVHAHGFTVYDQQQRVVAASTVNAGQDQQMHTTYTLTHYKGDTNIVTDHSVVTNVGERSRHLSVSFARTGEALEPTPWEKLSWKDRKTTRRLYQ